MVAIIVEESESGVSTELMTLRIGTFELGLCGRSWDTTIDVFLESISVQLMQVSPSILTWDVWQKVMKSRD